MFTVSPGLQARRISTYDPGESLRVYRLAIHLDRRALLAPGGDAEHHGEFTFGFDL